MSNWKNSDLEFELTPEGFNVFQTVQGNRYNAGNIAHGSFVASPYTFAMNGNDLLALERATTNEGYLTGMKIKE